MMREGLAYLVLCSAWMGAHGFATVGTTENRLYGRSMELRVSMKPAALPMMDAGKAFARSGEFLIDVTNEIDAYGGPLANAAASMRNAGDHIAQAAASCRFKTGMELVCDELRESAWCLDDATKKLKQSTRDAEADNDDELAKVLGKNSLLRSAKLLRSQLSPSCAKEKIVPSMKECSEFLEAAGAGIMRMDPVNKIGDNLYKSGEKMDEISAELKSIAPTIRASVESGQRMAFAAERMQQAGSSLSGKEKKKPPKGKAWLKGGA